MNEITDLKYWNNELIKTIKYNFGYIPIIDDLLTIYENDNSNKLPKLSNQQYLSLKYHKNLSEKINRCKVKEYVEEFMKDINYIHDYHIMGSYRRKKQLCGDIDVLIPTNQTSWINVAFKNSNMIIDKFSMGNKKAHFICQSKSDNVIFQLDIFLCNNEELPFMLFEKTGSAEFNINIRKIALGIKKIHLTNEGFKDINNKLIMAINEKIKTEENIFEYLNLQYIKPEDRV